MRIVIPFFCTMLLFSALHAQQLVNTNYPIVYGNDTLKYGAAGGLNLPQFSEIDLNNDGIEDLIVFDRAAQIVLTFLNEGTAGQINYQFAPEYMERFPQGSRNFMLARDFNCDGIKDLFMFNQPPLTAGGIAVLKGSYDAQNKIIFTEETPLLKYTSVFGLNDIFIFNPDLPGIEDIDGDGDLDIAAFSLDFVFSSNIWFYRNMSVENGHGCDSLIFRLEHQCFGMASETPFNNNTYYLSPGVDSCANNPYWRPAPAAPRHSGSSVTLIDWNNDSNMDLLVSDVSINRLNLLTSSKVNDTLIFVSQDSMYPFYNQSVNLFSFPSAYFVDVNNDGKKDMIAAPTETAYGEAVTDSVAWLYVNIGNDSIILDFRRKEFLVGEMIDLGRASNAAVVDVNGDGLLDIVAGHFAYTDAFQTYRTSLHYFENTGTANSPVFTLVNNDFGGFSSLNERGLYPTFGDLDDDGDMDLMMGSLDGSLFYVENTAGAGNFMTFGTLTANYKGIYVGDFSTPQLVDIDRDGDLDLMVGNYQGRLYYFENTGSASTSSFSASPTSSTFGFDLNAFGSGFAAPFFNDNDGEFELFLGHEKGGIIHLGNIDGNITGIYDTLNLNYGNIYTGRLSTIAIADFDANDTMDFVIGNIRGGLSFYTLKSQDSIISSNANNFDFVKEPILIFPNPTNGNLNIKLPEKLSFADILVYDKLGRQLLSRSFDNPNLFLNVELTSLSSGLYYLEIITDNGRQTHKVIVR